jgi:hypothetical protein
MAGLKKGGAILDRAALFYCGSEISVGAPRTCFGILGYCRFCFVLDVFQHSQVNAVDYEITPETPVGWRCVWIFEF